MNSSNVAVDVNNISKLYRIGVKEKMYDNFAQSLLAFIKSPLRNFKTHRSLYKFNDIDMDSEEALQEDIIWALRKVSFEIKAGEKVAIIGRNGAGKSTLLKILSRVTVPTSGYAKIYGRFSSLLEVGTGFHPELSGRENVYLNGTILGMRKKEVDQRFDRIVDFSGIEKFIDTPVKRYSSGMKVRLAFSVAAHLEPEILIVDEVLAVGDADFQQKCLAKMEDVGREGRTVIFVSHNMPAVTRLCDRAILIENGRLTKDGPASTIVGDYLRVGSCSAASQKWPDRQTAPGGDIVRLRSVSAVAEDGNVADTLDIRKDLSIVMIFEVFQDGLLLLPHFDVCSAEGELLFVSVDQDPAWRLRPRPKGTYTTRARIPGNLLAEGMHYVNFHVLSLNPNNLLATEAGAIVFNVVDSQEGDSARGDYTGVFPGLVRPLLEWKTDYEPGAYD